MKASKLFELALRKFGRLAAEQPIQPSESQTCIDTLNLMMYEYAYLGLGYTEISSDGDDITTPNYSWNWLTTALAVELAPEFNRLDNYSVLIGQRDDSFEVVLRSQETIPPPELTSNTPMGIANRRFGWCESAYYYETDDGILTEQNDIIITEDE